MVNCRGRGGHPPETLTALGYHTFGIYGHCHGHCDHLCPLRFPDNTALTQQFQFLIWSGLETFSCQAVDDWSSQNRGLGGGSEGANSILDLVRSDLPSTAKKRVSRARRASPNTAL